MKKNYIGKILSLMFLIVLAFSSCKDNSGKDPHVEHATAQQYTSNNELRVDSGIVSLTKPVNERIVATIPTISAESGMRIFTVEAQGIIGYDTRRQTSISSRVGGRIEKLFIKYNFQPVKQGQLIMEIYSPDLAAAQRELIYVARAGDENLLQKAKQRLSLLGMQSSQIDQVIRTGNIFYRVPVYSNVSGYILEKGVNISPAVVSSSNTASPSSANDGMTNMSSGSSQATVSLQAPTTNSTPVLIREGQYVTAGQALFTVYNANSLVAEFPFSPEFAAQIHRGDKLVFRSNANKEEVYTGTIGLIEPVVKSGQNFTLARVYLANSPLKPGQLIIASIPVTSRGWWLPREAVWKTGTRSIVFKKENDAFVPVEIQTGIEVSSMVEVITAIGDWEIAKNASFLVDSESFIKAKTKQN